MDKTPWTLILTMAQLFGASSSPPRAEDAPASSHGSGGESKRLRPRAITKAHERAFARRKVYCRRHADYKNVEEFVYRG